jgi:tetratricopeptide (TPR) repeat protein
VTRPLVLAAMVALAIVPPHAARAGAAAARDAAAAPRYSAPTRADTLRTTLARGDSAWAAGRFAAARAAYGAALLIDPGSVRANYKLAVLASRENHLTQALVLIRRARAGDPADPELIRTEARILAWSGRYDAADSLYARALAAEPADADARLELARLRLWEGRRDLAGAELARALEIEPGHREALDFQRELRAGTRPRAELGVVVTSDSDDNTSWSRTVTASLPIAGGLQGRINAGSLSASDPVRDATRTQGELGFDLARGTIELAAAGGARWLEPQGEATRSEATARASLGWRVGPAFRVDAGFAHAPLDETAFQIVQAIEVNDAEGSLEGRIAPGTTLDAGGGYASLSDGNLRRSGMAAIMKSLGALGAAGLYGRAMSFAAPGVGYFSPDFFGLAEARASLALRGGPWGGRVGGGLGIQQVGRAAAIQSEWHAEGRLAYRWAVVDQIELSAGASNSAASSTSGAYQYFASALTVRFGL